MVAGDVAIDGRALGRVELTASSADAGSAVRCPAADLERRRQRPHWFRAGVAFRGPREPSQEPADIARGAAGEDDCPARHLGNGHRICGCQRSAQSAARIYGSHYRSRRSRDNSGAGRFASFSQDESGSMGVGQLWRSHSASRWGGSRWGSRVSASARAASWSRSKAASRTGSPSFHPSMLITPWLVEGPVRAQVSLDQDGDRFAIAGDGDATIDRLMRAEGELARGVHLQARIRGSAIEFSGDDGVVLGAPFSATGRMPLAWAVPAWLADGAVRSRRHLTDRSNSVGASGCHARPGASSTRHQEHEHVGDREDRYRSPRGRAATRRCRGHGHHRGCRDLGRRSRPDPAGTDQAAIRSGAAGSRGTRLEGTSLVPHGLGRYRPSARHRRRVSG